VALTSPAPACKRNGGWQFALGQGVQDTIRADDRLHHEDLIVGKTYAFGHKVVTKEEIVAFGRAYDPQPMHTDEEAAKATPAGGLIASGWHTCAMMMRMICDGLIGRMASLGSPGVDEARWIKPVRPGDALSLRFTPQEKRVLASRPEVGLAKVLVELVDGNGTAVATWLTNQLLGLRHPEPVPAAAAGPRKERAPIASLWDAPLSPEAAEPDAYFEDRLIGETADLGQHTFTREEIIAFARAYDPQPFHLDEAAAKASLFGGLCASGWHTAAHFIRAVITTRQRANAVALAEGRRLPVYGPSPGFRNLAWLKPVYAGDTIAYRARLTEKIVLKSRPNRGILVSEAQGRNQKGEIVFAVTSLILADRGHPLRV
jgi:acyl dehydratase